MKKMSIRILSVLLALTMLGAVLSVAASAATKDNVKHYRTYTCLGDSIAAGYSMPDYKKKAAGHLCIEENVRIEGSYPALVADAVHAETFYPYAVPGHRSTELRVLLDPTYDGDWVTEKWITELSHVESNSLEGLKAQRPKYEKAIRESDLITIDIGLNDTWLPVMGVIQEIIHDGDPSDNYETQVEDGARALANGYTMEDAKHDIKIIMHMPKNSSKLFSACAKILTMSDYLENYEAIIRRIYAINPYVTVVAVSTYNPFKDWPEEAVKPLIQASQKVLYDKMNEQKAELHETFGSKFLVADVNQVPPVRHDTFAKVKDATSQGIMWDPHPTEAGHRYEADQILAVLPTACGCEA